MLEELLKRSGIDYKKVDDSPEDMNTCIFHIENDKEGPESSIRFIIVHDTQQVAMYLFALKAVCYPRKTRAELTRIANKLNCEIIHGTFMVLGRDKCLSFRISHSLEKKDKLSSYQLLDYIGNAKYAINKAKSYDGGQDES